VGRGLYRRGVHEPGLTKLVLDTFSNAPGGHFLDVGANIGYFSCLFGKLAGPAGKVVAIEPEPHNRKLLEINLRNNGLTNVTVHGCAVGAKDGMATLGIYKGANRGRHSLVDAENFGRSIEVPVRTLDDLAREADVKSWAMVKVDVEGYEPFVFEGGRETLSHTEMLAMEYAPASWEKAGADVAEVFKKLNAHFSRIYHLRAEGMVRVTLDELLRSEGTIDLALQR
jgi:FkbM family methyltransferase